MSAEPMRDAFEAWIVTRKLFTKYNANLTRGSDGVQYKDVRVQGHWQTYQAAVAARAGMLPWTREAVAELLGALVHGNGMDHYEIGIREGCEIGDYLDNIATQLTAAGVAPPGELVAYRVKIGDSNLWSYCDSAWEADFHGKQAGLKYEKQPLYASPSLPASAPQDPYLPGMWERADLIGGETDSDGNNLGIPVTLVPIGATQADPISEAEARVASRLYSEPPAAVVRMSAPAWWEFDRVDEPPFKRIVIKSPRGHRFIVDSISRGAEGVLYLLADTLLADAKTPPTIEPAGWHYRRITDEGPSEIWTEVRPKSIETYRILASEGWCDLRPYYLAPVLPNPAQASPATPWQSIDTAPKHHSKKIIGRNYRGGEFIVAWVDSNCWMDDDGAEHYVTEWRPYQAIGEPA